MQRLYSIGDFSKITNISIDTLRYYDKINLLTPEYIDPYTNYRHYSYTQLVKLDIIKVCRSLGISLEHIAELFSKGDPAVFEESLSEQQTILHHKITALEESEKVLDKLISRLRVSEEIEKQDGFYYSNISERQIAVSKHFIDFSKDELSNAKVFIELTRQLRSHQIPNNYEGGYIYNFSDLVIDSAAMFEVIDKNANIPDLQVKNIPAGRFLCMNYCIPNREEALEIFLQEIKKRGQKPLFLLEIYLINGTFDSANRRFELQCLF